METNQSNSPKILLSQGHAKDKYFGGQMKRVFACLNQEPKTMLMVSYETGILRSNICRYIARLEELNLITIVRKGLCPISKYRAGFYSTNPVLFPAKVETLKPNHNG